jgi:hypothetical protein
MASKQSIAEIVQILSKRNWVTFAELEQLTGWTKEELIASKAEIEQDLRGSFPDSTLVSRIDLRPEGFEVTS